MKIPQALPLGADPQTFLVALLVALLVAKLVNFFLERLKLQQTFKRMQVAGPPAHLLHGHLYDTRRVPFVEFAEQMHSKFGNNVGIYLGGDPFLLTKDLDLIQQVFVANSRIFFDRMPFYLNIDPVPDNLICQRGDRWRYMRKLLTPAFSNAKLKSSCFYRDVQQTVKRFCAQLEESSATGGTIVADVYDRMAAIALDVIVKTAFHMDDVISFATKLTGNGGGGDTTKNAPPPQEEDAFLATAKRATKLGMNPLVELIFCFPFLDKPLTFLCNHLYFGSIIKLLFDRLDYLVRARRRECHDAKFAPTIRPRRIIDSLIEVLREKKITRSEFTGNAFVILFAGFETTANALTFTLYLLATNSRVQEKLRAELQAKMALVKENSNKSETDRVEVELVELATGCSYLEMVLNESLRLYPPVPGLSCRQASRDCTLGPNGMRIEKGVNIVPSVYSIHRDTSIWGQDAAEFRPERFELLDINQLNSAMFMPFGLGPRNCIGKAAALHELKIVIGRLILGYSIESCGPELTPDKLKLCSPINITITNSEKIALKFRRLDGVEGDDENNNLPVTVTNVVDKN